MSDKRDSHDAEPEDLEVSAEHADDVRGGQGIVSPRDPASGLPTGKRQHADIVIIKTGDKSSPG